jgi:hypothetical protein
MDFGDIGSEVTEINTAEAIARAREQRTQAFVITGTCYNERCGDDSPKRPFCSAACRDEYDRLNKLKARLGNGN